ncbi:hypothetical protein BGY98DRAFT_1104552 [Russula aff. rugulosa BPL654]|nr:hypothetical protein BGY98DRAFT_1104552 [Russula aff. rugulosa BPL654]
MKIYGLYDKSRQMGIKAGIINVMVDIKEMFRAIPIQPNQAGVVQLKLKRRIGDSHHYLYEPISPNAVFQAAEYLVRQPLFQSLGITIDNQWGENPPQIFNVDQENDNVEIEEGLEGHEQDAINNVIEQETLMDANQGVEFAPGEGQVPLSLLLDENAQELGYPHIFGGHKFEPNPAVNLSASDLALSIAERRDEGGYEIVVVPL